MYFDFYVCSCYRRKEKLFIGVYGWRWKMQIKKAKTKQNSFLYLDSFQEKIQVETKRYETKYLLSLINMFFVRFWAVVNFLAVCYDFMVVFTSKLFSSFAIA